MRSSLTVRATEPGLVVRTNNTETLLGWRWVRDHGEDPASFDSKTKQRRVYALGGDEPAAAQSAMLAEIDGIAAVAFVWHGDAAQTWISLATLTQLVAPLPASQPARWHRGDQADVTKGSVAAVLSDDAALAAWLGDLHHMGFGLLGGFSGGHNEATALARRIGYPRSSIFGPTWDLASDIADHDDTAYSQSFLAPHTDGTYSHEAPGLQMFCCVERGGTGGESVVVDAFAIAETLRNEHPEDFETLTTVRVPGHYVEDGIELRAERPAIRLDDKGNVAQVSMNNYDRSPMYLPAPEMHAFYTAYGRLHELANDRSRWFTVRLEPGDVLINDNWRVLHGRLAYTGARRFIGCYLNHEDFESRLRTVGA